MLPSEHQRHLFYTVLAKYSVVIGIGYMMPGYRANWRTFIYIAFCLLTMFLQYYTVLTSDRETALRCITMLAIGWQGLTKLYSFVQNAHKLRMFVEYVNAVALQCDRTLYEATLLIGWSRRFALIERIFSCIIFLTSATFWSVLPYVYVTSGEWILLLPIKLPYFGYAVQLLFQAMVIIVVQTGLLCSDLSTFMIVAQVFPLAELLMHKLRVLGGNLVDGVAMADERQRRQTREYLHNIVRMHTEFFVYVRSLSETFYLVFIVEILFSAISMCILFFVLMQITWFPLYMFALLFFVKALYTCILGALVEIYVGIWSLFKLS